MTYMAWAFLSMATYGAMLFFLKLSLRNIAPEFAVIINNAVLVLVAVVWTAVRGTNISAQFSSGPLPLIYLMIASAFLSVGVMSLYKALSLGPASVVQPIFALNFVVVSVLGLLLLGEPFKVERVVGLVLAGVAIWLLAK